jgi:CHAT domain-containing protein
MAAACGNEQMPMAAQAAILKRENAAPPAVSLTHGIFHLAQTPAQKHFAMHKDPAVVERELRLQYDLLIAPVAHALSADTEELVTFIPSGPLIVTPFAALTDGDGKPFVERHTIAVAPSLQTLLLTRNLRPGAGTERW